MSSGARRQNLDHGGRSGNRSGFVHGDRIAAELLLQPRRQSSRRADGQGHALYRTAAEAVPDSRDADDRRVLLPDPPWETTVLADDPAVQRTQYMPGVGHHMWNSLDDNNDRAVAVITAFL